MTNTADNPGRAALEAARLALESDEPAAAAELLSQYLQRDPDSDEALHMLGAALIQGNTQPALARRLFKWLAEAYPGKPAIWTNLGRACVDLLLWDEALDAYRKALALAPGDLVATNGIASGLLHTGSLDASERAVQAVLAVDPDDEQARSTLAHILLQRGDYGRGWDEYSFGVGRQQYRDRRQYNGEPRWSDACGRPVAVYAEQGIGDQIAFMEGFNDFRERTAVTLINCHRKLRGLFARSFPGVPVYGDQFETDPDWPERTSIRWSLPMSGIPRIVRRSKAAFRGGPFLVADEERIAQWRALLDRTDSLKVGIAWTGGSIAAQRDARSTTLDTFAPLLRLPGIEFVCLEYKGRSAEIEAARDRYGCVIHDWPRATQSQDMDDVAGLVAALDLVVSVPTAVVHIAGGLGKPVHCITHPYPHFHYGLGDRMPYYASVTCHHRKDYSDAEWAARVAEIAAAVGGVRRAA